MTDAEIIKILEERIGFQEEGSRNDVRHVWAVELTRQEALAILAILKRPDDRLMGRVFHALAAAERDRRKSEEEKDK